MRRAPDAAAQLVELRQAEGVGAVDQHRVGARDVETALDDRGAEQHVRLAVQEAHHAVLEVALLHLAVRDQHAHLGHELAQHVLELADRVHAVVHEEDLPAALHLAQDRLAHHRLGEARHLGADREPVGRRRVDHREIAQARHRHLQRARDRRRGERQHVHGLLELLDALLVRDAEALLLVDDQQAEIAELDVLLEQPVRADDDVDRAARQPLENGLRLLRRAEARERVDAHGIAAEALLEGLLVLLRTARWSAPARRPACRPSPP